MKIMVYEARGDEQAELARQAEKLGVSLETSGEVPMVENTLLAEGCQGVSILGQGKIDGPLLEAWYSLGVRYLSTRTVGYDHLAADLQRNTQLLRLARQLRLLVPTDLIHHDLHAHHAPVKSSFVILV